MNLEDYSEMNNDALKRIIENNKTIDKILQNKRRESSAIIEINTNNPIIKNITNHIPQNENQQIRFRTVSRNKNKTIGNLN